LSVASDRISKWFIFPKFREEGPPSTLSSLISLKEDADGEVDKGSLREFGLMVLLGYRPATVLSLISVLAANDNGPMYGSQLGRALEEKFELPEGWYTRARYYEDRLGRVLRLLTILGSMSEEQVKVTGSQRVTTGYRLSGSLFQLVKHGAGVHRSLLESYMWSSSKTMRICNQHSFVTLDPGAKHCVFCGKTLVAACVACGRQVGPHYDFCVECGEKLTAETG
jgi:hypothetical protein